MARMARLQEMFAMSSNWNPFAQGDWFEEAENGLKRMPKVPGAEYL